MNVGKVAETRLELSAMRRLSPEGPPALWLRPEVDQRMNVGPRHLFAIHLLTASGAALALLAVMAVSTGDWNTAFLWLGIALLVDGVDGPLARRYRVRERLPKWDGAALDNVIDYTTYVFVPAIIVAQGLGLPAPMGTVSGIIVAASGALYYGDTRMKQPDNSFRGFPVVWNMAAFVLYAFNPPPALTLLVVILLAVLTFLPVNFVHPVRVVRWRGATLAVTAVWFVCGAWLLITNFRAPLTVTVGLVAASAYLICVSAVQQYLRSREAYSTRG